jgi:hypothetical protein
MRLIQSFATIGYDAENKIMRINLGDAEGDTLVTNELSIRGHFELYKRCALALAKAGLPNPYFDGSLAWPDPEANLKAARQHRELTHAYTQFQTQEAVTNVD